MDGGRVTRQAADRALRTFRGYWILSYYRVHATCTQCTVAINEVFPADREYRLRGYLPLIEYARVRVRIAINVWT